eukprot:4763575-Pleurochrysis_carterae.AAC.1
MEGAEGRHHGRGEESFREGQVGEFTAPLQPEQVRVPLSLARDEEYDPGSSACRRFERGQAGAQSGHSPAPR